MKNPDISGADNSSDDAMVTANPCKASSCTSDHDIPVAPEVVISGNLLFNSFCASCARARYWDCMSAYANAAVCNGDNFNVLVTLLIVSSGNLVPCCSVFCLIPPSNARHIVLEKFCAFRQRVISSCKTVICIHRYHHVINEHKAHKSNMRKNVGVSWV